jgi:phosphoesterase RecJ-like protein
MNDQLSPLIDTIERHESFLLISHIDPDGDAIGSLIAFLLLLERKGKTAVAYDRDGVPEIYRFLEGSDRILSTPPSSEKFEVAIFLECPNAGRAGAECEKLIDTIPVWVNLDHHADNASYGHINIIRPELSAVSEMIYTLFELMGEPLDAVVATALYTAIMTDTGSYKYSNTSPASHIISARLLEFGIKPYEVYQKVYEDLSVPAALIAARAHGTLEIEDGISCITITRKMLEETGSSPEDTHDIVSYGRTIANIEVALLFRETEDNIKVSLRSTHRINVNKIAVGFNGGGHLRAAGCNIKGSMEEVRAKVFAAVRKAIAEAGSAQQTDGQ